MQARRPIITLHQFSHASFAGKPVETIALEGDLRSITAYSTWTDHVLFQFQELVEPNLVLVPGMVNPSLVRPVC